jgi:hypothetical protein
MLEFLAFNKEQRGQSVFFITVEHFASSFVKRILFIAALERERCIVGAGS